jgi:hypothetical protein
MVVAAVVLMMIDATATEIVIIKFVFCNCSVGSKKRKQLTRCVPALDICTAVSRKDFCGKEVCHFVFFLLAGLGSPSAK